jgi:hypothetical protein
MKITELISQLEALRDEHGDLEAAVFDPKKFLCGVLSAQYLPFIDLDGSIEEAYIAIKIES